MSKKFWILAIAGVAFAIDQITKWLADCYLQDGPYTFISGILSFDLTLNKGGLFGLEFGPHTQSTLAVISVVVVLIVFFWVLALNPKRLLSRISFGLILGGALGNLFDRIFRDGVIDFIQTDFMNWPTFNLADVWLCVAAVYLVFELFFCGSSPQKQLCLQGESEDENVESDNASTDDKALPPSEPNQ